MDRMRPLVIGTGVAGTVAALALQKAGCAPTIYEAYDESAGLAHGVYLTVAVNGIDALRAVDAHRIVFDAGFPSAGITFYAGTQFPAKYRGGAFIAFHGSWNRAPLPQGGFKVVYVPFSGNTPAGTYETFADGFGGPNVASGQALHRPVGVAVGPDGSLYVTDDQQNTGGRIYRIMYRGR